MGECILARAAGGGGEKHYNTIEAKTVSWASNTVTMTFDVSEIDLPSYTKAEYPLLVVATFCHAFDGYEVYGSMISPRVCVSSSATFLWSGSSKTMQTSGANNTYYNTLGTEKRYNSTSDSLSSKGWTDATTPTISLSADYNTLTVSMSMKVSGESSSYYESGLPDNIFAFLRYALP